MQRTAGGQIRYQLVFLNAPGLDDQIVAESPYETGQRIDLHDRPESFRDTWELGDIWNSADGKPDILVMSKPPIWGD